MCSEPPAFNFKPLTNRPLCSNWTRFHCKKPKKKRSRRIHPWEWTICGSLCQPPETLARSEAKMCTLAAGKWLHLLFLPLIWDPQKCRKLALIVNDAMERESLNYLELVRIWLIQKSHRYLLKSETEMKIQNVNKSSVLQFAMRRKKHRFKIAKLLFVKKYDK